MPTPHWKHQPRIVQKGWGHEEWFHNDWDYCGKVLHFHPGKRCSLHFHLEKTETFYAVQGAVRVTLIHGDGTRDAFTMTVGEALEVPPGLVHQIHNEGGIDARVVEASTQHFDSDSYRVERGD
jgi:mannose-6-phosphate isomerase-like protein (cupin superfamily)